MEQLIIISHTASGLNKKIAEKIEDGFVPVGEHKVVTTRIDIQNAGNRHLHHHEYSQTVKKG